MAILVEIIGDAKEAAPYIDWAKREFQLLETPKAYRYVGNCLVELSNSVDKKLIRFYTDSLSGFVTHPRSGNVETLSLLGGEVKIPIVEGGWGFVDNKLTKLETRYPFPLIDDDNASLLVSNQKDNTQLLNESSSYGNYYLINGDEILSWKGVPNRHSSFSKMFTIPGLDSSERSYSGFTENIYSKGVVVGKGPLVGGVYGHIHGLTFYDSAYVAVVRFPNIIGLYSSKDLNLWEMLVDAPDTVGDKSWWFIDGEVVAVSSDGDRLTIGGFLPKLIGEKTTVASSPFNYGIYASSGIYFEGGINSTITGNYISEITLDGNVDTSTATERNTRSEFFPDEVAITRNGLLFCAALSNSENKLFTCRPCPTVVTWAGPVIPVEGTSCAELESECYPPGVHEITISADVTCGAFSASGSITLIIHGSAGYWGNNVCTYEYMTWENIKDANGQAACSSGVVTDLGYCLNFTEYTWTPQSVQTEIVGNKKFFTLPQQGGVSRSSNCPCACSPHRGYSGPLGGTQTVTGNYSTSANYIIFPDGTYYCSAGGNRKCTNEVTTYSVTNVPFGQQSWVCL